MEYIRTATEADADECIFCSLPAAGDDEAAHVLRRGELAFVVLNAFPYNPGHLMVASSRGCSARRCAPCERRWPPTASTSA
jgi:ATP adenylyltransferase